MAKWRPLTPEEWAAKRARYERLQASTNRTLQRGFDAAERGEDIAAAMKNRTPEDMEFVDPEEQEPPELAKLVVGRLRHDGWTAQRQRDFLIELAESGSITQACARVGMSRPAAYALRRRAPHSVFAIGWDVAIEMSRRSLIDEAMERALNGREIDVMYRGEQVGTRIVHNDRLLMYLIAHKPAPIHPVLAQSELEALWPIILEQVDAILPSPLNPARLAELGIHPKNGNDEE